MYKLTYTSNERWIFISAEFSFDEPDEFIAFVKEYQSQYGGKIIAISVDTQYRITEDPLNLVFQWDSLFGITVIVPNETDISIAENSISHLCDKLNEKQKAN